jgi:hypothetical protein
MHLPPRLLAAALLALPAAAQSVLPPPKVENGRTETVLYDWSPVLDLWGNVLRGVWTLRKDGILYLGPPEGSLEDFAARAPTEEETQACGTWSIRGAKFSFTWPDGRADSGDVEYAADGSLSLVKATTLRYFPATPLAFPIS